jgi:hypothetical protein
MGSADTIDAPGHVTGTTEFRGSAVVRMPGKQAASAPATIILWDGTRISFTTVAERQD